MRNIFFNKTISIFLTMIFLFGLFPPAVFAGPVSSSFPNEVRGFNKTIFDNSFSRADREINPESWLTEAKLGITQAIFSWELIAVGLYDDPQLLEEAKNYLEKWSNEELESRFSNWLVGRFFGEAAERTISEFSNYLDDTQKKYSWQMDSEGNVIFDDKTGDPLVIRPYDDDRTFSEDIVKWQSDTKNIIINAGSSYESFITYLFPELLAYIPPEQRIRMSEVIYEAAANKTNSIKNEFENIAAREERIFTSLRTRDIWSLRSKSENESAKLFTERLITETDEICKAGIEELNIRIEQAEAGTGDLALLGDEWLKLYKEQFEKGLKAWEEAEERFFIRRIEWEQDSLKLFSEGNDVWFEAFDQFEKERQKWELNAKDLLNAGETLFTNLLEDFQRNIDEAREEFELNMRIRQDEGTAKVKALIDMYIISSSTAIYTKEIIQFWLKEYDFILDDPSDPAFLNKMIIEAKESKRKEEVFAEIKSLYEKYLKYMNNALSSRENIINDYAKLLGTGTLKDILSSDVSSEDFCLDEYQIALIRAKALVLHWERKTIIAEAVENYAEDLSANRITETEGIRAWEKAKAAYNKSLENYEIELNKLNKLGSDIEDQYKKLEIIAYELQTEESKLNALYDEYKTSLSLSIYQNENYYYNELTDKYQKLVNGYRTFEKSGNESIYKDVLLNGLKWGIAETQENNGIKWQESLEPLVSLFQSYGYDCENYYLPDVQDICETIFNKSGNFLNNTAQFLVEFDNCFTIIPQWLEKEIENWRNAFAAYAAVYSFCKDLKPEYNTTQLASSLEKLNMEYKDILNYANSTDSIDENELELIILRFNEIINDISLSNFLLNISFIWENIDKAFSENNKHWRQYINNEYFNNIDYLVKHVSSWKEGTEADAFFTAGYYTNRLNDSFILFSQKDTYSINKDSIYYSLEYNNKYSEIDDKYNILLNQHNELLKALDTYKLSKSSLDDIKVSMEKKEIEIKAQEEKYEKIRSKYLTEAEKIINLGALYDAQYSTLNNSQSYTDQMRFEYEKQDAIQRWASTAYTNINYDNLKDCKTNLEKAKTVLIVLSDLYNDEEYRSFNDPKYNELYSAYKKSFDNKLKILETVNTLKSSINNEIENTAALYNDYQKALYQLGSVDQNYSNYASPSNLEVWTGKDIIMVKNGKLAFSRNDSMKITGVNKTIADELINYFETKTNVKEGHYELSNFEKAISELNTRMSGYLTSEKKFYQWSLARDYLISSLIAANKDIEYLNSVFSGYGQMTSSGTLGSILVMDGAFSTKESLFSSIGYFPIFTNIEQIFRAAWKELSQEEQADLEFYVILTLTNSNGYSKGFSEYYTSLIYQTSLEYVNKKYVEAVNETDDWYEGIKKIFWNEVKETNRIALNRVIEPYFKTVFNVAIWIQNLNKNQTLITKTSSEFTASVEKLNNLRNIKTNAEIEWEDIHLSLLTAKTNNKDITAIKSYWETMQKEATDEKYYNVIDALNALYEWYDLKEEENKAAMNDYWEEKKEALQEDEKEYLTAVNDYLSGSIDKDKLKFYANKAYGENAAAWKTYYNNMYTDLLNDISLYMTADFNFYKEFLKLGAELSETTQKVIENKYLAELNAREAEWQQAKDSIKEKLNDWNKSAELILETGRLDWIKSQQKMQEAYEQWFMNFQNEYERVSNEWALVYLAGLEDKENWLEQAANAANQAASESFLSLVGTEGERLSRFVDTREPMGIRDSTPQAQSLMNELLQSSGITSMASALSSLSNYAGITSPLVKRGIGSIMTWDSASSKIAAMDMAKESNSFIADNEAKKLAYNVNISINETIKGLASNVESANKNFRNSIDDLYIFNGLWRKSGNNYVKEVVKGSTLFSPVISETANIIGYENYNMEPIILKTNLNEHSLANLNSMAIDQLIENAHNEIEEIADEIFGLKGKEEIIKSFGEERKQSPGKFGAHIGHNPDVKPTAGSSKDLNDIFYDYGKGQLGRLMTAFTYWKVVDNMGMSELALAPWDKRIWNDEGSWFNAPSLRAAGQIVGTIAATVASVIAAPFSGGLSLAAIGQIALLNSANDILFNSLDVSYGYKTWDEAAFNVGKSYAINVTSGFISAGFGVIGKSVENAASLTENKIQGAVNLILGNTMVAGSQAFSSGFFTSLMNGITYNHEDRFGFSDDLIMTGLKNMMVNTTVSMVSTFTSTSLTATNIGYNMGKVLDFDKINKEDLEKFNNLAGSFAGQGVNYAMGNDFTLNLLNFSLLSQNSKYNIGLLELHLGRDGVSMNLGTGGANVSIDNLAAAFRGLQVWTENIRFNKNKENEVTYDSKNHNNNYIQIENEEEMNKPEIEVEVEVETFQDKEEKVGSFIDDTWVSTDINGDYQNSKDIYKETPLFDSLTEKEVEAENQKRKAGAFIKYLEETFSKDEINNLSISDYDKHYEYFIKNEINNEKWGYIPESFISIGNAGCMFMIAKLALEAIGEQVSTMELHDFIKNNNYYWGENNLSKELMETIINAYSNNGTSIKLDAVHYSEPTIDQFLAFSTTQEEYFVHMRVQDPVKQDYIHSVMLKSIDYKTINGEIVGINSFNVINPLKDANHHNGQTSFTISSIVRMDFYKVTRPTQ